jgi:hypothetical protein
MLCLPEQPHAPARDLYFVLRDGGMKYHGKSFEALIRGDWKLLQNDPFSPFELYNLKDDPLEKNDLFAARPDVVREMSVALRRHIQRGGALPWQSPTPAPSVPPASLVSQP